MHCCISVTLEEEGSLGAESKEKRARVPPGQSASFRALGYNNKYSYKIIAKMLHLSTETYNNEQVSKVFRQNFS